MKSLASKPITSIGSTMGVEFNELLKTHENKSQSIVKTKIITEGEFFISPVDKKMYMVYKKHGVKSRSDQYVIIDKSYREVNTNTNQFLHNLLNIANNTVFIDGVVRIDYFE